MAVDTTDLMRQDWDERARKDAFHYIASWRKDWTPESFLQSGEEDRVLKSGGMFLFQFNSVPKMTMNWKRRLSSRIVDFPWALGFRQASRGVASLLGLPPGIAGKSWRGDSLDVKVVRETIETAGAAAKEMTGEETSMTWCCGLKSRTKAQ